MEDGCNEGTEKAGAVGGVQGDLGQNLDSRPGRRIPGLQECGEGEEGGSGGEGLVHY